ncbi:MAG TPA: type II secretion system protein [Solirubrobacteraceae bacterium]|nr:type II secretion system protein [Solirubrobacteraceae bacterium]
MSLTPARSQDGFTLIELLVVTMILGILAAIALPAFAGQKGRGQDASAKSDAVAVSGLMEQCHIETGTFRDCDTAAELSDVLGSTTGATYGNAAGQVRVNGTTAIAYHVRARSRSNHDYNIIRAGSGPLQRTCHPPGEGGCPADGTW